MAWKTAGTGKISDREFEILSNEEGDLRIRTTNSVESDPTVFNTDGQSFIGIPGVIGDTVEIDFDSEKELRRDLESVGIGPEDQNVIVSSLKRLGKA